MNHPEIWTLVETLIVLGLAVFRIFRLIGEDTILDTPRAWLVRLPKDWEEGDPLPEDYREKLAEFITCPWCCGFWLALLWWGAWELWPEWTLVAATPWALSCLVGVMGHFLQEQ